MNNMGGRREILMSVILTKEREQERATRGSSENTPALGIRLGIYVGPAAVGPKHEAMGPGCLWN